MTRCLPVLAAACALAAQTPEAFSPTTYFRDHCATCHGFAAVPRAPSPAALRSLAPEAVYSAITTGSMKPMAADLTDAQRTALAETLTEQKLGVAALADLKAMSNPCPSNPPLAAHATVVNGYGTDLANSRFISSKAAGLRVDVPRANLSDGVKRMPLRSKILNPGAVMLSEYSPEGFWLPGGLADAGPAHCCRRPSLRRVSGRLRL